MVEWRDIPWRKLEKVIYKLQKRIYQASLRGDVKAVRRLQKTVMKSWYAIWFSGQKGNTRQSG